MNAYSIQHKLLFSSGFPACPLLPVEDHSSKVFECGRIREAHGSPFLNPSSPSTHLNWIPAGYSLTAQPYLQGAIQTKKVFRATSSFHPLPHPSQQIWGVLGALTGAAPGPWAQ